MKQGALARFVRMRYPKFTMETAYPTAAWLLSLVVAAAAGTAFSAFCLWRKSVLGSATQHYRLFGELSD
jgi:hypothetical protein